MRKLLKAKTSSRTLIQGKNAWSVPLVRYLGPFIKLIGEPQQMNQRTRTLIRMHTASHPRNDRGRLYVPRKEGGRGLARIQDNVDASIQ